jgi:predicted GH43/DUF377 family glycosyl hydrolase
MWFTAAVNFVSLNNNIGFAVSDDGVSWSMHTSAVLSPSAGKWDSYTVEFPCVIRENGIYKMYYAGNSGGDFLYKIGVATSSDGINWTKDTLHNPVLVPGTEIWEKDGIHGVCVIPAEEGYKMWYEGFNLSPFFVGMGYATSVDGISWQKDTLNNPLFSLGALGEWDDGGIHMPNVIFIDSKYYMYYGGMKPDWSNRQIGLATSSYGNKEWIKYSQNPVISPSPGMWDSELCEEGRVLLVGDTLYMWYAASGYPGGIHLWQIGLAKSLNPVSVKQETIQPIRFSLEQNFPNPFNPSTKIKYSVLQTSQVQIKVFDILGTEIETLVNEEKAVGTYELNWNAPDLPSGVYFYQLRATPIGGQAGSPSTSSGQGFVETKKMLLLK